MFKKALFASAAVMAAGVASAEVTGNFAVTSDYIFRGVSYGQAVQGGLDWSNDSGLYAGVWLSNTDDTGTSVHSNDEIDLYVGYGLGLSEGLSLDLGYIRYTSDSSSSADIDELYVGVAGEAWGATLYYGDTDDNVDDEYLYLDLGYSMSTGETTSVDFHVGYTEPDAGDGYADLGVTLNVGDFAIGATMIDDESGETDKPQVFVAWGTEFDVK